MLDVLKSEFLEDVKQICAHSRKIGYNPKIFLKKLETYEHDYDAVVDMVKEYVKSEG